VPTDPQDLAARPEGGVKVCPKCGAEVPPPLMLVKCVVCESVYCGACKGEPTAHPFWCHQWRHGGVL
jgi:hypothetical protein